MKKLLLFALFLFAFSIPSFGAAPTYATVDGVYEWTLDTVISAAAPFDTLASTTDSVSIVTKYIPRSNGWDYILTRGPITGTGSDSVALQIRVDVFADPDSSTAQYTVLIDTFTASAGEAMRLPFGGTLVGRAFTIKAIGVTGHGTQAILGSIHIWRRRVQAIHKNWR